MAQLSPAIDIAEEIRAAVAADDLPRATKRLMDFADQSTVGRELRNETSVLTGEFHRLNKDIRRFGGAGDEKAQLTRLSSRLLALLDEIETARDTPAAPAATPPESEPNPEPPHEQAPSDQTQNQPTSWARARDNFFAGRRPAAPSAPPSPAPYVIEARNLTKRYRGGFELSGVDVAVRPGEVVGFVGVNGSGKSTLLRILAGQLAIDGGELAYPLLCGAHLDWVRIKSQIAFVPQRVPPWHGRLATNLHLQAGLHGLLGQENEDEVEFILHRLGLETYRDARWSEISGGYQMRFELARALLSQPRVLILDEPLAPLDINTQQLFLRDLRDLANSTTKPLAILLSSQHIYEVEAIADSIHFLDDGKAAFSGSLDQLHEAREEATFELATPASQADLLEALHSLGVIEVEATGLAFLLSLPRDTSGRMVLEVLLAQGLEIGYFRSISGSTRKLFRGKGD